MFRADLFKFERILAVSLPERTDHRDGLVLASAVSNLDVEFVDGVRGEDVSRKALPAHFDDSLPPSVIGAWRAHINAIARVVEKGWSSALILEDDVDWDVRLPGLMQDFALDAGVLLSNQGSTQQFVSSSLQLADVPKSSPYGDGWDVLWLGHCGMEVPSDGPKVVHHNDDTVPEPRYLHSWDQLAESPLMMYPPHTRVAMNQKEGVCSLAYAVSQAGARSILLDLGLRRMDHAFDIMLRQWCEGTNGHEKHVCLGVLPQLFDHHRRAGPSDIDSDIATPHDTYRDEAFTLNIRWSVRMNMDKLLHGLTDYDDQYPNG